MILKIKKSIFNIAVVLTGISLYSHAHADNVHITMYKQTGCMCCDKHADILGQEGFDVELKPASNMNLLKARLGIPEEFVGCHTMLVDGYIVEGHVPGSFIHRLLEEKPEVRGISVPGMPVGSPGMPGERTELIDVYVIEEGKRISYGRF